MTKKRREAAAALIKQARSSFGPNGEGWMADSLVEMSPDGRPLRYCAIGSLSNATGLGIEYLAEGRESNETYDDALIALARALPKPYEGTVAARAESQIVSFNDGTEDYCESGGSAEAVIKLFDMAACRLEEGK